MDSVADAITASIFIICVTILIILCAGEPDLLDAIRNSMVVHTINCN